MNLRRVFAVNVAIVVVILGVLYFGWSYYDRSIHYVSTDDATVAATVVPIQPEFAGKLQNWSAVDGQRVTAGQTLGSEATGTELTQLGAMGKGTTVAYSVTAAARLTTPISGTISDENAQLGGMLLPGVTVANVVDTAHPYIIANIAETAIRHVQVGENVDVYVDSYPDLSLQGTVKSIGLAANSFYSLIPPTDSASGNYTKVMQTIPVTITLTGSSGEDLIPGTNATVRIHRNSN
jgi:multidrug resistance efflux pump